MPTKTCVRPATAPKMELRFNKHELLTILWREAGEAIPANVRDLDVYVRSYPLKQDDGTPSELFREEDAVLTWTEPQEQG